MTIHTMSPILFDTHAFVKNLTAAGFTMQQAEALAHEQAGMIENKLATKDDMKILEVSLRRDMKELEMRMTIKLGAISVATMGIFTAIITTIIKFIN